MKVKTELIKSWISDYILYHINDFEIDENKIADTTATKILDEIHTVVCNLDLDDFQVVEEIGCIFEKYKISSGCRHDFG